MLVTLREASRILGLSAMTLCHWRQTGLIRTKGKRFSDIDVLAAAVGRDMRRKGFSIETAAVVMRFIQQRTLKDFQSSWQSEKRFVVGCGPNLIPWLLCRDEMFGNEFMPMQLAVEHGLPVVVVDTRGAYETLQQAV